MRYRIDKKEGWWIPKEVESISMSWYINLMSGVNHKDVKIFGTQV